MIQQAFSIDDNNGQRITQLEEQARECVAFKDRVFIYQVDVLGQHQETSLDVIILNAVMQQAASNHFKQSNDWIMARAEKDAQKRVKLRRERADLDRCRRIEMAIMWNRIDLGM